MARTFEYTTHHIRTGGVILSEFPDALVGHRLDDRRVLHFQFELPDTEEVRRYLEEAEHGDPLVSARAYDAATLKLRRLVRDTRG